MMNKGGRSTAPEDPQSRKTSPDLEIFDGKNLAGVFSVKPAPAPLSSMYDSKIYMDETVRSFNGREPVALDRRRR
jgi:multiple sugar transport system substrate-binding protein